MVDQNILTRLFNSFSELEQAITSAKTTLKAKENVPEHVINRLNSYDGLLEKQRALAFTLCEHINRSNWSEVQRHVTLINGLSSMIRDDARSVLGNLRNGTSSTTPIEPTESSEETHYC